MSNRNAASRLGNGLRANLVDFSASVTLLLELFVSLAELIDGNRRPPRSTLMRRGRIDLALASMHFIDRFA
jgi:hypothetical protein